MTLSSASNADRVETVSRSAPTVDNRPLTDGLFMLSCFKAFRNLQLENSQLTERFRQTEAENVELKAQARADKKVKGRSKAEQRKARAQAKADAARGVQTGGSAIELESENIPFLMGKKFLLAGSFFLESDDLNELFRALAPPPFAYDSVARYDRSLPNHTLLGHLADLYHVVPESFHDKMASPVDFQTEVRYQAHYQNISRLDALHLITVQARLCAAAIVYIHVTPIRFQDFHRARCSLSLGKGASGPARS